MHILTNEERSFFGLKEINENWAIKEFSNGYMYINDNIVEKIIHIEVYNLTYTEKDYNEEVTEDHKYLISTRKNAKNQKLSINSVLKRKATGMSFMYSHMYSCVLVQNEYNNRILVKSYDKKFTETYSIINWINDFIENNNNSKFKDELSEIISLKKKKVKIKQGDVFAFKLNNNDFGFGRVLLDMNSKKNSNKIKPYLNDFDFFSEHPLKLYYSLLVEIYSIQSSTYKIDTQLLNSTTKIGLATTYANSITSGAFPIINNIKLNKSDFTFLKSLFIRHRKIENKKRYFFFWGINYYELVADEELLSLISANEEKFTTHYPIHDVNQYNIDDYYSKDYFHLDLPENINIKKKVFSMLSIDMDISYEELCEINDLPDIDLFFD